MDLAEQDTGQHALMDQPVSASAVFEGTGEIAAARNMARAFLERLQAAHGLPVSQRIMDVVQLVVSELVTNANKYAPGPSLLTLETHGGAVQINVWDSSTMPPAVLPPDPTRIGQHGLEVVMAISHSFAVHREPVGKRITAAVMLADDPGGDVAGRQPL